MDDDEDIFADLESFCVGKNLDKAIENFTIKNDSLDDIPEILDNVSEKVTAPKHSSKSRTKKQANSSSSQNEYIFNEFTSNNVRCTREKKKIDDAGASDNQTVNSNTHNTKSADKADDSRNTNLNNTSRRTRQGKKQNVDINNTKSTDEANDSQNANLNKSRRTRQRKRQNNDISTTKPTDEAAGISNNNTSLNNTAMTKQKKRGRRNNATDNFSTPPPLLSPTTATATTSNQTSLSNSITTLMQHIMESMNSRRRSASNRRRGRSRGGRTRSNQYQPPTSIAVNQNARARRNLIAEVAARAPVVDCIDLISSPIIQISTTEPIDLDLEENVNENENIVNNSTDCNEETDNVTLKIKVKWGKDIKLFPCRKYQKFTDIIKHFAELENVPNENVCLNLDEKIISENDTPDSINYKPHMFIYGRKVKDSIISTVSQGIKDPNSIEIKIQCKEFKRPIIMSINKSNTFAVLYEKCSEELKIPTSKIVLKFDGETLNAKDKPVDFDLEGNEIIDCHIKK